MRVFVSQSYSLFSSQLALRAASLRAPLLEAGQFRSELGLCLNLENLRLFQLFPARTLLLELLDRL